MRLVPLFILFCTALRAQGLLILPKSPLVLAGHRLQLSVQGHSAEEFQWSADQGKVDEHGAFTAPQWSGLCHVSATSRYRVSESVTMEIRVLYLSLEVSPKQAWAPPDGNVHFQASMNVDDPALKDGLKWKIDPEQGLSSAVIDPGGNVFAGSGTGDYRVTAWSADFPDVADSAEFHVFSPRSGSVNPENGNKVEVYVSPGTSKVFAGEWVRLSAETGGIIPQFHAWSIVGNPTHAWLNQAEPGEVVFHASKSGEYRVRAASMAYPECFAEATIAVIPSFRLSPLESLRLVGQSAVSLNDQAILILGGWDGRTFQDKVLRSEDDVASRESGRLSMPRARALAVVLSEDRIMLVGGLGGDPAKPEVLRSAEIYYPTAGRSLLVGACAWPHIGGALVPLPKGRALLLGGTDEKGNPCGAECFDGETSAFRVLGTRVWPAHAAIVTLGSGQVLILGGELNGRPLKEAWLFDPGTEAFARCGAMNVARSRFGAIALGRDQSKVLVCGGRGLNGSLREAELFSCVTGHSIPIGAMAVPREGHALIQNFSGSVEVVGGSNASLPSRLVERWGSKDMTFDESDAQAPELLCPVLMWLKDRMATLPTERSPGAGPPLPPLWGLWD